MKCPRIELTLPGLWLFFLSCFTDCHLFILQCKFLIFLSISAGLLYFEFSQPLLCFLEEECSVTAAKGFWELVWNVNCKEYTCTLFTHPSKSHQSPCPGEKEECCRWLVLLGAVSRSALWHSEGVHKANGGFTETGWLFVLRLLVGSAAIVSTVCVRYT